MKKITLLLITLMMLTCFSSAASLKKTIGGVSVTTVPEGRSVTLRYAKDATKFSRWIVATNNVTLENPTSTTVTFTMPGANVEIIAEEAPDKYKLAVSVDGEMLEEMQRSSGDSITLTAVEGNGRIFSSWQITGLTDANATANPLTFTMPNNAVEIIATFIQHTHSWVNATCTAPKTCSTCGATEGVALNHSYTGTRTCDVNGSTDTVQCIRCSATESQTCTHEYTISKGSETNGTITLSATSVKAGGSVSATITPSSGYEINTIAVNGTAVIVSNKAGMTHTISNITANQTVTATFKKQLPTPAQVPVGAYIEYVPTSTSVKVYEAATGDYNEDGDTSDYQEFNPSSTTSWRVMYNNNGQLDIVSSGGVNATNGEGLYLKGATGYARAVDTLNNLCNAYVNTTYATSGRSIGCTSSSVGTITTPITWNYTYHYGNTGSTYTDTLYSTDVNQLKNNNLLHSSGYTWLASRYLAADYSSSYFYVRYLGNGGDAYDSRLYYELEDGYTSEGSVVREVRPVVSLKSGIQIVGGTGTAEDPYIIQ